jgi:hypothetical protein
MTGKKRRLIFLFMESQLHKRAFFSEAYYFTAVIKNGIPFQWIEVKQHKRFQKYFFSKICLLVNHRLLMDKNNSF